MNQFSSDASAEEPGAIGGFVSSPRVLDIVDLLRRRWPIVACSAMLGVLAAVLYWYITPPTYESYAQLLIMKKNPQLATSGVQDNDAGVTEDILATHMQIVQSHRIVTESLRNGGLQQLPSLLDAVGEHDSPTKYVQDHLDVTRGGDGLAKKANVLNISFRHKSAEDARRIVEALIGRYQAFVSEQFKDVNEQAAGLISHAREELETELKATEEALVESRKNAPLLWEGEASTNIHRARFEQIQNELSTLRLQSEEVKARLQIVEEALQRADAGQTTILQKLALIDDRNLTRLGVFAEVFSGATQTPQFQTKQPGVTAAAQAEAQGLLTLLAKEKTLLLDFGPNHPEVVATRQQVEVLRKYLADKDGVLQILGDQFTITPEGLVDAYARLLAYDLEAYRRRETELQSLAASEEAAAKELVVFELEDKTLHKQLDRKQALYDATVERLREINLAKDYGGFVNEIIAPPELGEEVWPSLPLCGVLGIIAGLFLGVGGAFGAEHFDRSFRDSGELARLLDLPILAQVPRIEFDAAEELTAELAMVDRTLCVLHDPQSPTSEVFRGLRTQLFFAGQNRKLQLLAVTSPKPADGKSTLTANLAASLAQAGRSVLLVDCDMRKPRLHKLFGIANEVGLVDAVRNQREIWKDLHQIGDAAFWFLPSGQHPSNPAELLESTDFVRFLEAAQQRYDYVVLDCPPVLRVSDPCIVASRVDGVIMTMRMSQVTKPEALHTRDMLLQNGGTLIGLVANCWDVAKSFGSYGGYGGYGYGGYGYGYGGYSDFGKYGDDVKQAS